MDPKTFESAIAELEQIVQRIEQEELPLETALELFERGIKLSRFCNGKLDDAEQRISILLDDAGQPRIEPFTPTTEDEA